MTESTAIVPALVTYPRVFKNYASLALALGLPVKTGEAKIKQLAELGLNFIITNHAGSNRISLAPRAVPLELSPKEGKWLNDTSYTILANHLSSLPNSSAGYLPKYELAILFKLVNQHYYRIRAKARPVADEGEEFFFFTMDKIIKSALSTIASGMARTYGLSLTPTYHVKTPAGMIFSCLDEKLPQLILDAKCKVGRYAFGKENYRDYLQKLNVELSPQGYTIMSTGYYFYITDAAKSRLTKKLIHLTDEVRKQLEKALQEKIDSGELIMIGSFGYGAKTKVTTAESTARRKESFTESFNQMKDWTFGEAPSATPSL